jgi:DnaJ-class molecular chaperone
MLQITYQEFEDAVETLGLVGVETRDRLKKRYLKLSKQYHPDMPEGDDEKFQKINKSYKIIQAYMDHFRFRFTQEEFENQHPFSVAPEFFIQQKKG